MLTVELDDFDFFMLKHSLEFRSAVDGYLDAKTIDDEEPTDKVVINRARTMKPFIDYMLRERGIAADEPEDFIYTTRDQ